MIKPLVLLAIAALPLLTSTAAASGFVQIPPTAEPMAEGKFKSTWESLQQYEVPAWFRDAKFGIWAHWGPQCEPEDGDWYARKMYEEGNPVYQSHLAHYGHPSKSGFKDVIHVWKAQKWDPEKLVALYKRAGAKYFFALANHHDNLDLWDSKYQPWNSVRLGPKKDLIAGWAQAAHSQGLRFGVSVHASHAWTWYETAQGADKKGALAGVPYDGRLTKAEGKGQWWEGLDPQDLYAQNHPRSKKQLAWEWPMNGDCSLPDTAYCEKFYNRTIDLLNRVKPDLLYFDDTVLPLWPMSDAGLKIAAHFYNTNMQQHGGQLEAVLFGKILQAEQKKALVWDVERGVPATLLPYAWQTDTCIGDWHYQRSLYDRNGYKTPKTVIQMLADIVSKNGNLLLNIPLRGDGSIDDKEEKVVAGITAWMDVNQESIFSTRPWKIFGEGPGSEGAAIKEQGFNEGKGKALTEADVRFTTKGETLYVIQMAPPTAPLEIKSLGKTAGLLEGEIAGVRLLGSEDPVKWTRTEAALTLTAPAYKPTEAGVVVYRVDLKR